MINVTLPNTLKEIRESIFRGCKSLTNIIIPSGITKLDYSLFYGCTSLTSISYLGTTEPTIASPDVFEEVPDQIVKVPVNYERDTFEPFNVEKNIMIFRKLITLVLFILIVISCSRRTFPTKFFEFYTSYPTSVIDSIALADTLEIPKNYVEEWNRSMYITSDSVIITQYVGLWIRNDMIHIMSITEEEGDSIVYIKYRKE